MKTIIGILITYGLFYVSMKAQDTVWSYSLLENSTTAYGLIKTRDGILYAGTGRDGRIFTSHDNGESWDFEVALDDSLPSFVLFLYEDSNGDIYAGTRPAIANRGKARIKRKQYGDTQWIELPSQPVNHNSVVATAMFSSVVESNGNIYVGVSAIVEHDNGQIDARGEVWRLENDAFYITAAIGDNDTRSINSLLVDSDNNIYAGTGTYVGGEVYKSINGGLQWEKIGGPLIDSRAIRTLAKDHSETLYAGSNHLYKLENDGESEAQWQRVTIPTTHGIGALEIGGDGAFYAGAYGEIFKTVDSGTSWETIGKFENTDLIRDIDEYDNILYAAANVNGMGAIFKSSPQLDIVKHHASPRFLHYTIYPNPVPYGASARLHISLPQGRMLLELQIFNILGQLVKTVPFERYARDPYADLDIFDGKDMYGRPLATGLYIVSITTRDFKKKISIDSSKLIYTP